MKALMTLLLLLLTLTAHGQESRSWEQALADIMTADDMETEAWEDTYEMLCELEQNPMNLNMATREELELLPFLTARQVEAIMEYLYRYGPMKSMNELRMIRELDYPQIELLRYFVYVEEKPAESGFPPLDNILKYGRHEVMADVRVPFYRRKGDENGYLGYPYRHWLRYQFSYQDYVKAGIVGSQDAGEPFFSGRNGAGYDFYSYYLQVKHLGRLENMVVGKYKLTVGMGLVLNNSFGLGKLAMLQQLGRDNGTVIRPHSSRSASGYFQGAAATLRLSPRWQLTTMLSYRPFDGTLNNDSTLRTIVTDGYHRTPTEMAKKHNSHATDAGAHIAWRQGGLRAGATVVYTHLDRRLCPDTKPLYRRYAAQGQDFVNLSADYGYLHPRFAFNGETALNRKGAVATINSLNATVADGLDLLLLQRFYSYRYTALYARSVAEGGHVQNESALYLGATWRVSPRLRLQAYTDYAHFAWARYGVSRMSKAWDNLLSFNYSRDSWSLIGRYRLHLRQHDNEAKTALDDNAEHRGRLSLTRNTRLLSTTTQADAVSTGDDWGYMLSETVGGQWRTLKAAVGGGYFHTTGYASRLYVYERSPRYNFSYPAFYGEGMRLMLMLQGALVSRLTLTAKVGLTRYFDRSTIGTGLQQINSSSQTDLDLQLRWKF